MHAGTCKYFTGVGLGSQKQRCDKGVEYRRPSPARWWPRFWLGNAHAMLQGA